MKSKEKAETGVQSRRGFLKSMAVTGGAVAFTAAAGKAVAGVREEPEEAVSVEKHGYRETQHIKDYYARAGF